MSNFDKEKKILYELDKARKAVKYKHGLLKYQKDHIERAVSETFKPISDPLQKLVERNYKVKKSIKNSNKNRINVQKVDEDYKEETNDSLNQSIHTMNDLEESSIKDLVESDNNDKTVIEKKIFDIDEDIQIPVSDADKLYGIQKEGDFYKLGNVNIRFTKDNIIVNNQLFPRTPGLFELITNKQPKIYEIKDLTTYKKILEESKAHLNKDGFIKKHTSSFKYNNIIAPLFALNEKKNFLSLDSKPSVSTGKGLLPRFKVTQKLSPRMDYVYWNDPNELVDRLQLLIAERSAGNQNHENEIHSIIEELREGGYIY